MNLTRVLVSLKWRVIRNGPNDERGFGLVAGGVLALGVCALAAMASSGTVDSSWVTLAVTVFGATWLLGPIMLPGSSPVLDPQWLRGLPHRPIKIARAIAPTEAIGVGVVITAVALVSIVILAAPQGPGVAAVAAIAAAAQLFFLLWLGRCTAAWVRHLLRSKAGISLAAIQMSVLLSVSFAGWVPVAAFILPGAGDADYAVTTPDAAAALPEGIENVLLTAPTGWSVAAVNAAAQQSVLGTVAPILGLAAAGLLLRTVWIAVTARTLNRPPTRAHNAIAVRHSGLGSRFNSPAAAVTARELKTWFRDPQRALELRHAWLTPLLMIPLVAPTDWNWALPFIGVAAVGFAAMVAVNTYALDGTALWQLLTTPGAIHADMRGRQLAWTVLFGLPAIAGTLILSMAGWSPFSAIAIGAALAGTGTACAGAPLLGVVMPALGADARYRTSTAQDSGNAAGGQMTIFGAVLLTAVIPGILATITGLGSQPLVHIVFGGLVGGLTFVGLSALTRSRVERAGPRLLAAMAASDITQLRSTA